jgi:hypothetical protein
LRLCAIHRWQAVTVVPSASVDEPAMVESIVCLSSAAPEVVCASTDPYLVFSAAL